MMGKCDVWFQVNGKIFNKSIKFTKEKRKQPALGLFVLLSR